jgi:orotidine-5'-phosphate decarboxylase
MPAFLTALTAAIERTQSVVCVGLDPVVEQIPVQVRSRHHEPLEAVREFCFGIIDATCDLAPVVKPQSACFERFGSRGVQVLEACCAHARARGMVVLLDAKRGDIGISAEHYAAAALHAGAHAITVNAYLGPATIEPYLNAGLGVFALVRTSNPDSDRVQSLALGDGRTVAEMMADHVATLGERFADHAATPLSALGAVVGATKSVDAAALRARMTKQIFLIPGYGAQGGTASDIVNMRRPSARSFAESGVLVNASRSILYAKGTGDWQSNARDATQTMRSELARALEVRRDS